jgi:hypothetical protein
MASLTPGEKEQPPMIVTQIRARITKIEAESNADGVAEPQSTHDPGLDDQSLFLGADINSFGQDLAALDQGGFPLLQEQNLMGFNTNAWGWPAPSFNPMMGHGW